VSRLGVFPIFLSPKLKERCSGGGRHKNFVVVNKNYMTDTLKNIVPKFDKDDKQIKNLANAIYRELLRAPDPNFCKSSSLVKRLNGGQQFVPNVTHLDVDAALQYMLAPAQAGLFPGLQGSFDTGFRISELLTKGSNEQFDPNGKRSDEFGRLVVATRIDSSGGGISNSFADSSPGVEKIRMVTRNKGQWMATRPDCGHDWVCHDDGYDHCLDCGLLLRRRK